MTELWDTSILSRCLSSEERMRTVVRRALDGNAVRVAAPAVLEVVYGLERVADAGGGVRRHLRLLERCMGDGTLRVIAFDRRAAFVAGRLRAHAPHALAPQSHDRRTKTMRQAAWLMDIQIAATAFASGHQVATDNRSDFDRIARLLTSLFPAAPALQVAPAPA